MRAAPILLSLAVMACHSTDPVARARQDQHDVAMVRAAQHVLPPPAPLVPQAVAAPQPCRYADPAHAAGAAIVAAGPDRAVMRLAGQLVEFAADHGATAFAAGAWSRYAGRRYSLRFEPQGTPATPTPSALKPGGAPQPVALIVTDEHDRKVLETAGDFTCG